MSHPTILSRSGQRVLAAAPEQTMSLQEFVQAVQQGSVDVSNLVVTVAPADDVQALIALQTSKQIRPALVAIEFPKFTDGRGYSHAALIRQYVGTDVTLRAVGDVLIDQLFYMMRVGFDQFALREDQLLEPAQQALQSFSVKYQAASDVSPLFSRRTHSPKLERAA